MAHDPEKISEMLASDIVKRCKNNSKDGYGWVIEAAKRFDETFAGTSYEYKVGLFSRAVKCPRGSTTVNDFEFALSTRMSNPNRTSRTNFSDAAKLYSELTEFTE